MLVFVAWSNLIETVSSVTWNGEALNYLATASNANSQLDVWYSDGTAQTSGTVTATFTGTVSNSQCVAMLFGDLRRAGGGWLDDWFDLTGGLSATATVSASATYSKFKGTTSAWAFLWETDVSASANQGDLRYSAIAGTGATVTQLIVGTSEMAYQTAVNYVSTLSSGTALWSGIGVSAAGEQTTRGMLRSGSVIHPTRQLTS